MAQYTGQAAFWASCKSWNYRAIFQAQYTSSRAITRLAPVSCFDKNRLRAAPQPSHSTPYRNAWTAMSSVTPARAGALEKWGRI